MKYFFYLEDNEIYIKAGKYIMYLNDGDSVTFDNKIYRVRSKSLDYLTLQMDLNVIPDD